MSVFKIKMRKSELDINVFRLCIVNKCMFYWPLDHKLFDTYKAVSTMYLTFKKNVGFFVGWIRNRAMFTGLLE